MAKVIISYRMSGAIEVDLEPAYIKELQEDGREGFANFLDANYSYEILKDNLGEDSDDFVVTTVYNENMHDIINEVEII